MSSSSSDGSSAGSMEYLNSSESAGRYAIGESAFWLATVCALAATIVSISHIYSHLRNYNQPYVQRLILRILAMIPLYALTCWISLLTASLATVTDAIRGCYESFVLWMFFNLMVSFFGSEAQLLERLNDGRPPTKHLWPFDKYLSPIHLGTRSNFLAIKRGILQFALLTPVTTLIYFICKWTGSYTEGSFSFSTAGPYLTIVDNISVSVSLYYLVLFYQAIRGDLASWNPLPKFLCVKGIIFATYWQSVILSILAGVGIIYGGQFSTSIVTRAIGDFLICLEMIPFAFYHRYAFPTSLYPATSSTNFVPLAHAARDAVGLEDVLREGLDTIEGVWKGPEKMNIDRSGDYEAPSARDRVGNASESGRHNLRFGEERLVDRKYQHGSIEDVWDINVPEQSASGAATKSVESVPPSRRESAHTMEKYSDVDENSNAADNSSRESLTTFKIQP